MRSFISGLAYCRALPLRSRRLSPRLKWAPARTSNSCSERARDRTPGSRPRQLNTLNELSALRACWKPPALENAHPGMQMTMRFALNRDGKMIGPPQVTYSTAEVSPRTREIYREAMLQSLEACTPFPLTGGLGGAIAGRPFFVWVDRPSGNSAVKPRA